MNRVLGPEMAAEGWRCAGGECLYWTHEETRRSVTICARSFGACDHLRAMPAAHRDPNTEGYVLGTYRADDKGFATEELYVWCESYAWVVSTARDLRRQILEEYDLAQN